MNITPKSKQICLKLWPMSLAIAFAIVAWVRLVVNNSDLLIEAQDQSSWQSGSLFFAQMTQQPGGILSWAGRFLTQFFFYPALGAGILIVLWLAIYALWLLALRPVWYLKWAALLVPTMLLWSETALGYAIYSSKIPDWWFTPTLFCLIVSLLMAATLPLRRCKMGFVAPYVVMVLAIIPATDWMEEAEVPEPMRVPFHTAAVDERFQAEIRTERALENGEWSAALNEVRRLKMPPTRSLWIMKNIALLNEKRLAEDWLQYPCLTTQPSFNDSIGVPMVFSSGPLIYFMHGSVDFAYRWSVENAVEYGFSVKRLRLLTRCALVNGEWDLAERYLNQLSRTTFYGIWAEEQRKLIGHPEQIVARPENRLAVLISDSRPNQLDGDNGMVETYLINAYAQNGPHFCAELSELGLVYAMQSQDIALFWPAFFDFVNHQRKGRPMPTVVQEAAYLYIQLEPATAPRRDFPFDQHVVDRYRNFSARTQQLMHQGCKQEAIAQATQREFGKSFYWFYFFCRNQNTY